MTAKLLQQIKSHPRVEAIDGKQEGFADWFVYLRAGWKWAGDPGLPTHDFGAATLTECMKEIRSAQPCHCDICKSALADAR